MVSFFLAAVAGALLSGAFAPLGWWFLLPVSIAVFLYAVTKTRIPFSVSIVFAVIFNYLTLKWTGTYVGLLPVLFLVILQSLFYLPLGFVSYKRGRYSRVWLLLPILLVADKARSVFPFGGFGWNRISFSQAESPYRLSAAFLGESVLSFIGISLGIVLYLLFARAQLLSVAIALTMTTAAVLLPAPSGNQGSASILAIQGNVPRLGLDFNARAEEVFNYHLKQTTFALNQIDSTPDLIVWPENSVDVDPFQNPFVGQQISDIAKVHSVPIIVGAVLKTKNGPQNASIMWDSNGRVVSTYIKRTLTPFGEYIPLRSLAQLVSPLTKNVKDFVPGKEIITHSIEKINVVPIICYEVINDADIQSSAARSNVLIVQTNNATFADSAQSYQQLNISRIRAIENNRWLISVSTTGVSAFVDNTGKIIRISQQNKPQYLSENVELISDKSIANHLGSWSSLLLIVISFTLYAVKRRRDE